jgi:hypothetical protein
LPCGCCGAVATQPYPPDLITAEVRQMQSLMMEYSWMKLEVRLFDRLRKHLYNDTYLNQLYS